MGSSETSLGVKAECLELLGHLADVPQVARNSGAILRSYSHGPPSLLVQCLPILVSDGILRPLIALLKLPDAAVEASAAELLAKLAQVKEYQLQISHEDTLPQVRRPRRRRRRRRRRRPPPPAGSAR